MNISAADYLLYIKAADLFIASLASKWFEMAGKTKENLGFNYEKEVTVRLGISM